MEREKVIRNLEVMACDIRQDILTMTYTAQSGHPGGSLSAADIITALYFYEMNTNKDNLQDYDRDRFVLSKGHCCPALYSALIEKGVLNREELYTLRKHGSRLQGHPDMKRTPGVEISTGSLGQGLGAAVGMAIGLKRDNSAARVFALLGDGECDEGMVWESVQVAAKYQLDNLTIFVDKNRLQNDGFTKDIMPLNNLADKFEAFGCEVVDVLDGHNMGEIVKALDSVREITGKPKCIITHGTKGRGVSFMENVAKWHGVAPNKQEYEIALNDVRGMIK